MGHFSGVYSPEAFPQANYIQAYETTSHVIAEHDQSSLMVYALVGKYAYAINVNNIKMSAE